MDIKNVAAEFVDSRMLRLKQTSLRDLWLDAVEVHRFDLNIVLFIKMILFQKRIQIQLDIRISFKERNCRDIIESAETNQKDLGLQVVEQVKHVLMHTFGDVHVHLEWLHVSQTVRYSFPSAKFFEAKLFVKSCICFVQRFEVRNWLYSCDHTAF